jgi:hypothetical protein
MSSWVAKKIEEARDEIKQKEEEITKEVIIDNIRHGLTDYVAEYTVSTISLPDEKIKGKIIDYPVKDEYITFFINKHDPVSISIKNDANISFRLMH